MTIATCHACQAPIVCEACESCAAHCSTPGGPDACWEAIEQIRRDKGIDRPPPARPNWQPTDDDCARARRWLLATLGSLYPASVWDGRVESLALEFAAARGTENAKKAAPEGAAG